MKTKFKHGLKVWSTNRDFHEDIIRLYEQNYFYYIEIYVKPNTFNEHAEYWKSLPIPYVIHAPHYGDGMNLSVTTQENHNKSLLDEARRFADTLKSDTIILHSGVGGKLEETIRQIKNFNEPRLVIENKPKLGQQNEACLGYSPESIETIIEQTGLGFCFDVGHGICAANSSHIPPLETIKKFKTLKPRMWHVTDGSWHSEFDRHDHYGEGDYPLNKIFALIPEGAMVTNEAYKKSLLNLSCFKHDIETLAKIIYT